MSLHLQRSRQGVTNELVFSNKRRETQFVGKQQIQIDGRTLYNPIGRYVDRLQGFNPNNLPGTADVVNPYLSLDVRLAWWPQDNLEIAVIGQNLLDNHHPESGSNPLVRAPLVEIQRAVYEKIRWQF